MNLLKFLQWRYATKRMNGSNVAQDKVDKILEAINLAPTSFGLQPFQVIEISDAALRERIFAEACQQPQIKEGSHLLVFAANRKVTQDMVDDYMKRIASTRNIPIEALDGFKSMLAGVVAGTAEQNFVWTARQAYIAFGIGLAAAAELEVDATPMEGFNPVALDNILSLESKNLSAVTIITLGYRDEQNDSLAKAAKVRKELSNLVIKA